MLKIKEYQKVYQEIKRVKSMANETSPLPTLSAAGLKSKYWSQKSDSYQMSNRRLPVGFLHPQDGRAKKESLQGY